MACLVLCKKRTKNVHSVNQSVQVARIETESKNSGKDNVWPRQPCLVVKILATPPLRLVTVASILE